MIIEILENLRRKQSLKQTSKPEKNDRYKTPKRAPPEADPYNCGETSNSPLRIMTRFKFGKHYLVKTLAVKAFEYTSTILSLDEYLSVENIPSFNFIVHIIFRKVCQLLKRTLKKILIIFTYLMSGCASNMALIKVVPDLGTPPMKINGIFLLYL